VPKDTGCQAVWIQRTKTANRPGGRYVVLWKKSYARNQIHPGGPSFVDYRVRQRQVCESAESFWPQSAKSAKRQGKTRSLFGHPREGDKGNKNVPEHRRDQRDKTAIEDLIEVELMLLEHHFRP
jgi:hypothetical protein